MLLSFFEIVLLFLFCFFLNGHSVGATAHLHEDTFFWRTYNLTKTQVVMHTSAFVGLGHVA